MSWETLAHTTKFSVKKGRRKMKKVLALVLSLVLVVGVVATLAACGGKDDAPQSHFE